MRRLGFSSLRTSALQNAILNGANFSNIATDEKSVIQLFNVGGDRRLGCAVSEVLPSFDWVLECMVLMCKA